MFGVFDVAGMWFATLIFVSVFSEGRFVVNALLGFSTFYIVVWFPTESLVFLAAFVFASLQWV